MKFLRALAGYARPGFASVRENWAPILVIQVAAVALVILFFASSGVRGFLEAVGAAKAGTGLAGSFIIGGVAAGLLPEAAKLVSGKLKRFDRPWLEKVAATFLIYAVVGLTVDILYATLARLFGSGSDWQTVAKKTSVDMLVYSPLFSIPFACTGFALFDRKFDLPATVDYLKSHFVTEKLIPSVVSCWIFWIPVLSCVYSFPTQVQFPIAMLAEAAWSILFVFMNVRGDEPVTAP